MKRLLSDNGKYLQIVEAFGRSEVCRTEIFEVITNLFIQVIATDFEGAEVEFSDQPFKKTEYVGKLNSLFGQPYYAVLIQELNKADWDFKLFPNPEVTRIISEL